MNSSFQLFLVFPIALRPISKNRFQSVRPPARLRQTNIPSLPFLYIMSSKTSTSSLVLTTLTENDDALGSHFEHDLSEYTVEQLKHWLKCRGLKQSGKRQDLVERVRDCINSGNHRLLDVSIDGGKWYAAKALRENSVTQMSEGKRKCIEDIPVVPLPPDWNNFQSKDIPSYSNYGH